MRRARWVLLYVMAWLASCLATPWVLYHQCKIRRKGRGLTGSERLIASSLGVEKVDDVYLLVVDRVPNPLGFCSKLLEVCGGACMSSVDGITLGHGIYVSEQSENSISLLAHELVHVGQYERAGSVWQFLIRYVHQCLMDGYFDAELEVEARTVSSDVIDTMRPLG